MEVHRRIKNCIDEKSNHLDLSYLYLTELPENMPVSLHEIYCNNNQLTELPENMPASLQIIDCSYNQLTKLPKNMPVSLHTIYCNNNQLTELPENMPASLELICYHNQLTKLPRILIKKKYYVVCDNKDELIQNIAIDIVKQIRKQYKNKKNYIRYLTMKHLTIYVAKDFAGIIALLI
jgi:Leucine-rich repeat (LRR) protein